LIGDRGGGSIENDRAEKEASQKKKGKNMQRGVADALVRQARKNKTEKPNRD